MLNHKNTGFIVFICFCLSILISGIIFYQHSQKKIVSSRIRVSKVKFPTVSQQDKVNIERLSGKIATLVRPSAKVIPLLDLEPLGYQKTTDDIIVPEPLESLIKEKETPKKKVIVIPPEVKFDYKISMIYISRKQSNTVINGKFIKRGESLPDGAKVLRIRKKKVLIKKQGISKWIFLSKN